MKGFNGLPQFLLENMWVLHYIKQQLPPSTFLLTHCDYYPVNPCCINWVAASVVKQALPRK
jgi:hypothetical protein